MRGQCVRAGVGARCREGNSGAGGSGLGCLANLREGVAQVALCVPPDASRASRRSHPLHPMTDRILCAAAFAPTEIRRIQTATRSYNTTQRPPLPPVIDWHAPITLRSVFASCLPIVAAISDRTDAPNRAQQPHSNAHTAYDSDPPSPQPSAHSPTAMSSADELKQVRCSKPQQPSDEKVRTGAHRIESSEPLEPSYLRRREGRSVREAKGTL